MAIFNFVALRGIPNILAVIAVSCVQARNPNFVEIRSMVVKRDNFRILREPEREIQGKLRATREWTPMDARRSREYGRGILAG